jgi:hypothetical protein
MLIPHYCYEKFIMAFLSIYVIKLSKSAYLHEELRALGSSALV